MLGGKIIRTSRNHGMELYVNVLSANNTMRVYVCVVSNNKGSTLSNVTIVKVHNKPQITHHTQAQTLIAGSQIPAMFICNAKGKPSLTF